MAGPGRPRKRAPSVSTVATIDDDSVRYLKETEVLKPAPPNVDTDEWPCFPLSDVTVYRPDGTIANILNVALEGPLIVRGKLIIEKDHEEFLINRSGRTRLSAFWIQIENSLSFSIGQNPNSDLQLPVVWASGSAGWFEITPSDKYKPMCDTIFQGINLYYSIIDQYQEAFELQKRKKSNRLKMQRVELPPDEVLFHYAVTVGDATTLQEAHQRCADQAIFLLSHLPKDLHFRDFVADLHPVIAKKIAKSEQIDRSTTKIAPEAMHSMFQTWTDAFDIPDRTSKNHASAGASVQRSMRGSEAARSESIDRRSDGRQSSTGKTTRSKRATPMNIKADKNDVEMSDATYVMPSSSRAASESRGLQVLLDLFREIRETMLQEMRQGQSRKHPDQIAPNTFHYKVYFACRIKDRRGTEEICHYFAPDLVRELDPEWQKSEIYKWAKAKASSKPEFQYSSEAECLSLARRQSRQPKAAAAEFAGASAKDSARQPMPPQPAGKQPPRRRGRPSGKAAGLRPSLGGKKRPRESQDDDEDGSEMDLDEFGEPRKTAKKSKYFSEEEDNDDAATSSTAEDDDGEEEDAGSVGPVSRLAIRAERLPSMTPKGPNGTWTCEEPGCGYVVRGADEEDGQDLISAHFEVHEQEAHGEAQDAALKRVSLAVQEAGGDKPIDHLLEKIRSLGDKTQQRKEKALGTGAQPLPEPIKRTLLV